MKCKRYGCPNLVKGQYAMASVYDELKAKTDKGYEGPHLEAWCLDCYQTFEGDKYTYVLIAPKPKDKLILTKRVKRVGLPGETIADRPLTPAELSPVDNSEPEWAKRAPVIDAAGIAIKSNKKPGRTKKQIAKDESPIEDASL